MQLQRNIKIEPEIMIKSYNLATLLEREEPDLNGKETGFLSLSLLWPPSLPRSLSLCLSFPPPQILDWFLSGNGFPVPNWFFGLPIFTGLTISHANWRLPRKTLSRLTNATIFHCTFSRLWNDGVYPKSRGIWLKGCYNWGCPSYQLVWQFYTMVSK